MKTVWSALAEISEFHLARPKYTSKCVTRTRPSVISFCSSPHEARPIQSWLSWHSNVSFNAGMSIILVLSNDAPGTYGCGIVQFDKRCTGLHVGYQIRDVLTSTIYWRGKLQKSRSRFLVRFQNWNDPNFPISSITQLFSSPHHVRLVSLFYNMPLWNQNRSVKVVTGKILSLRDFWLEIWIHFMQATCLVKITLHLINPNNYHLLKSNMQTSVTSSLSILFSNWLFT